MRVWRYTAITLTSNARRIRRRRKIQHRAVETIITNTSETRNTVVLLLPRTFVCYRWFQGLCFQLPAVKVINPRSPVPSSLLGFQVFFTKRPGALTFFINTANNIMMLSTQSILALPFQVIMSMIYIVF